MAVMLDTRMFQGSVKGTGYPLHSTVSLHFPSRGSLCAITFQLDFTKMNVSKIVGAYVQWLRVEPAMSLSFLYKLSSEHEISFGIKCAVHIYTSELLLFMCLNKLSLFASKFASAYMLYKMSIKHFSNTQFYHHN
jgi:hypothetical protein